MKNLNYYITIFSILIISFSCKKEQIDQPSKEKVQFSFEQKQLKSVTSDSAVSPTSIVITVEDLAGNILFSNEQIVVYNMNGSYISSPISMMPGNYHLTGFMVTDKNNNVLYLTPKTGSVKAYLVTNPLPINLIVIKNSVTKVIPEVLTAAGSTPQDFGYANFSFKVVKTFSFLIGVFDYNESTKNLELTNAHLKITADSGWVYEKEIAAATDTIAIKDYQNKYILTVTKAGFDTWTDTLTAGQLKLYYNSTNKGPLKIVVVKASNNQNAVTDIDGNVYHTVKIGNQKWMVENLKVTHYNDGTPIPNITNSNEWANLTTPGYCWYNNNLDNKNVYGALYNWYTINTGKLCPMGWHVPSDDEWTTLEIYLQNNGFNYDGSIDTDINSDTNNKTAKSLASTSGWNSSSNEGAIGNTDYSAYRNKTGFTALPGGGRSSGGALFYDIGSDGLWWSATNVGVNNAWNRGMYYSYSGVGRSYPNKGSGFSVRCLRDF